MKDLEKRVFFALDVKAPWPEQLPKGRLLDPEDRHATLAFLGEIPFNPLLQQLNQQFPLPPFKVGLVGTFSKCLFLPPSNPHVVAWDVQWRDEDQPLIQYQKTFLAWLNNLGYHPKEHAGPWLCHVTLARSPFSEENWKKAFKSLPMYIDAIHLYESLGNLKYKPLWSYSILPPFKEIEHTADIAYLVYGENYSQLYQHAQTALAFRYPAILPFMDRKSVSRYEDLIEELNNLVARVDGEIGCPFKAISFHGTIEERDSIFKWEMIVDV